MTSQNVDPSISRASKEMSSSSNIAMDGHAVTKRLQQDLMTLMVCLRQISIPREFYLYHNAVKCETLSGH